MGGPARSLSAILALMGTIMLGLAAISYVAANFWAIPRPALLTLIISVMWLAYVGGAYLIHQSKEGFGQAAVLLGAILFGTNIMLIAQMYHISAHYPNGVMAWALGALLVAILIPSRGALGLAYGLALIWTSLESFDFGVTFHWPFLWFWAAAFTLSHILNWRAGFHIGFLSLVYWLAINASELADVYAWTDFDIVILFTLFWLLIWVKGCFASSLGYPFGQALARYGIFFFLITFYIMHVAIMGDTSLAIDAKTPVYIMTGLIAIFVLLNAMRKSYGILDVIAHIGIFGALFAFPSAAGVDSFVTQWAYSAIYIAITIWLLALGARYNETFIINCALIAFGFELMYIYFEAFDSLLNQSMFFAIGGVLLVGLGFALETIRRRFRQDADDDDSKDFAEGGIE